MDWEDMAKLIPHLREPRFFKGANAALRTINWNAHGSHIYAALLTDGVVKFGCSQSVGYRLQQMNCRIKRCGGTELAAIHVARVPKNTHRVAEHRLLHLARRAGSVARGLEWFSGIHWDHARALVNIAAAEQQEAA